MVNLAISSSNWFVFEYDFFSSRAFWPQIRKLQVSRNRLEQMKVKYCTKQVAVTFRSELSLVQKFTLFASLCFFAIIKGHHSSILPTKVIGSCLGKQSWKVTQNHTEALGKILYPWVHVAAVIIVQNCTIEYSLQWLLVLLVLKRQYRSSSSSSF